MAKERALKIVEDTVLDSDETKYFTIDGREYSFHKLGLRDNVAWGKIIKAAARLGYDDLASLTNFIQIMTLQKQNMSIAVGALLFGLVDMADPIFQWMGSVLIDKATGKTLTLEDMYDENRFSPDSLIHLAVEVMVNKELQSFFVQLVAAHKSLLPELEKMMNSLVGVAQSPNSN